MPKKTKITAVSKGCADQISVMLGNEVLEQVDNFKFLGSYKSSSGDCTKDIKIRISMAKQRAVELNNIWKDKNIHIALKIKIMKTMI